MTGSADAAVLAGRALTATRRTRLRSDAALVRAAQRGSADAFAELFRRHWPRAHRAAWLVVHDAAAAEDIAQEAFLSVVRSLDRFDRGRPFAPWLHRIVVNRAIDWARSHELRRELTTDGIAELAAEPLPHTASRPSETTLAALARLSPEQRAVVVLRHLLDFTPSEIARALDLPQGTVNSRLRRGLDDLHELVQRGDAE